ncbi:MAG: DUF1822 family protein [Richelia sp. RM2_1_2]|nr:DUF1822 family protein [Richelia sp. SM2_1_7]NJM17258.1 DUF1822 family protein [Richelia sp. SM1_7_0]NJN07222.1 DUF1822 family protein [Richelia sp. RM1_1_1]NJO28186.1 DUF1822 family protein [Richelia sp. SL_2_1]NJO57533.1 DUF1822 family protein [Richelia sp. RM2_1_2]
MNSTQPNYLRVPLGKDAHRYAEKFAGEQDSVEKGKQVYLNTLAVYAVHNYLKWLNIETALHQSDSWNWSIRTFFDIADLMLPNVGRIECRPVLPGENAVVLPQEVTQERIGYVAVRFTKQLDFVEILGFIPAAIIAQSEIIEVSRLHSLTVLIDTINQRKNLVNLCQWLEGIFNQDWQSPELVLAGNFRSAATITRQNTDSQTNSISRAKVINLGKQIVSLIELTPTNSAIFDIRLRVYPAENAVHLPQNLQMSILDELGNACMTTQAETANDWIQLEFSCQHEEKFSVEFKLGETTIIEEFVV